MNKVYLIGNLTRDPELAETNSGIAVCRFAIAVNRTYSNSEGNREVDFFNITVWRTQAENCGKYLKKGSKVAIVGSLQTRTYEDKDGVKRNVTDIIASEVEFLSTKNSSEGNDVEEERFSKPRTQEKPQLQAVSDDDLPF